MRIREETPKPLTPSDTQVPATDTPRLPSYLHMVHEPPPPPEWNAPPPRPPASPPRDSVLMGVMVSMLRAGTRAWTEPYEVWAAPSSFHDTVSVVATGGKPLHPSQLQETRGIITDVSCGLVLAQQVRSTKECARKVWAL